MNISTPLTPDQLLQKIHTVPGDVEFTDVIDCIDSNYDYAPVRFSNGPLHGDETQFVISEAGENEGSCKIFSFAKLHGLDESQTLHCFGHYYRNDVLQHPLNTDHANIRTFMKYGWEQLRFEQTALASIDEPEQ